MRVISKLHWPYQITVPYGQQDEDKLTWLKHNTDKWYINTNSNTYCFQHEEDAIMFRLTWGNL